MSLDWIDSFLEATETTGAPRRFRLWAALVTISGVMERRVFTQTKIAIPTHTNMFVALAGLSGSGKSLAIRIVRELWAQVAGLHLSPDNVSPAAFYDSLNESTKTMTNPEGPMPLFVSPMSVAIREFGVFIPSYDMGFLSDLSDLWDNLPNYSSRRRVSKSVSIPRPTVNILAGVTPAYLGDLLPESAWGQGFASRFIFIYDHPQEENHDDIFNKFIPTSLDIFVDGLQSMMDELEGEFDWDEPARIELVKWLKGGKQPVPLHTKLREYKERRNIHALKLCMLSSISTQNHDLVVRKPDVERALAWLFDAEEAMPDVFRAMGRKGDGALIAELWYFMYTTWAKMDRRKRTGIPDSVIYDFMHDKMESHRISGLLEVAEKAGKIKKTYPGEWAPIVPNEYEEKEKPRLSVVDGDG